MPRRAKAYLVSTLGLEPEHVFLTTGTFNLVVKDRIADRLSGALQSRTKTAVELGSTGQPERLSLRGIRLSSKPV